MQRSTPPQQVQLPASPMVTPPLQRQQDSSKKKGVPHVYHDYAQVPDQNDYVRKKTGGVTQVRGSGWLLQC